VLLTLDGHVPADVQLRALSTLDEAALKALCHLTWRTQETGPTPYEDQDTAGEQADEEAGEGPVFVGEIALATTGRIVLRVPSQAPLDPADLVGGVRRVPFTRRALHAYQQEMTRATAHRARSVANCRRWLAAQGAQGRGELLEQAKQAALRTAPFTLYQENKQYTNFRDRNTLTGKTLWPGHPDCALSSLEALPLDLWSDHDVQLVVCLTLLIRSAGFGRVEEANGTQLSLDHIAHTLERVRRGYNTVPAGQGGQAGQGGKAAPIAPAASHSVEALNDLALALRARRQEAVRGAQLYREIHGPLMHKVERVAQPPAEQARAREQALCARLRRRLPLTGATLEELGLDLAASPTWLARPHGAFATGLESLVYETVAAAAQAFDADFAMSRGMRSLPALIRALREQSWAQICDWDITRFFCCVVPLPQARRHFADSPDQLADAAWAMSSRMQYNSWHFVADNLPKVPEVQARDHFVSPAIPDVAYHSDQHHHGHVTNQVRFSIRSPQAVEVDGRRFNGFMDLRLLRCAGTPFTEQDLLAAHRTSSFVARATSLAAALAADGEPLEVTAFDAAWHRSAITAAAEQSAPAPEQSAPAPAPEQSAPPAPTEPAAAPAAGPGPYAAVPARAGSAPHGERS
jgi:hypothetical protein